MKRIANYTHRSLKWALTGFCLLPLTLLAGTPVNTTDIASDAPVLPTYQIELIVFSHLTNKNISSEKWPQVLPDSIKHAWAFNATPDLNNAYLAQVNFNPLPTDLYQLTPMVKTLDAKTDFQVLLHMAWQQIVLPDDSAQTIHLYGSNALHKASADQEQDIGIHEDLPYNTNSNWEVDGEMGLSVKRYFDTHFNLLFAIPTSALSSASDAFITPSHGPLTYFHLLENRRMRSGELNYIDNPLFGVLIKISKVKDPLPLVAPAEPSGQQDINEQLLSSDESKVPDQMPDE